jgi:molybdenum cofactor cytidylyltransferase
MTTDPRSPHGPLVAILAAGSARRFGGGKLDAPLGGRALGAWALANAAESGFEVAVVVGSTPPSFALEAHARSGIRLIDNPCAAEGMGTSVACAARAAVAGGHAGLIVLLADMPFVDGRALANLIHPDHAMFARHSDDVGGPPAWIPARLLPRLVRLSGERGARSALADADMGLIDWPVDQLLDIDTPEALDRARGMIERPQGSAETAGALPGASPGIG